MLRDTGNKRAVRILLECILVQKSYHDELKINLYTCKFIKRVFVFNLATIFTVFVMFVELKTGCKSTWRKQRKEGVSKNQHCFVDTIV